jgi:hypothetical protein
MGEMPILHLEYDQNNLHVRWVPCHHSMKRPQVAVGRDGLQIWGGSCEYYLISSHGQRQGVVLQLGGWAWG